MGAAIRARLSAAVIEAELAKGRATSLDKAVAYALEGLGDLEEPASAAWPLHSPGGYDRWWIARLTERRERAEARDQRHQASVLCGTDARPPRLDAGGMQPPARGEGAT